VACRSRLFPGSSAVERSTVNRNVAGSIPAQGAITRFGLCFLMSFPVFVKPDAQGLTVDVPNLSIADTASRTWSAAFMEFTGFRRR
jgi:hypothetical protein